MDFFRPRHPLTPSCAIRSFAIVLVIAASAPAGAQTVRPGTFRIVVRDPAKLPIAAAQVTLKSDDAGPDKVRPTSASGPPMVASTSDHGEAVVDAVPPGTYVATIDSSGFMSL